MLCFCYFIEIIILIVSISTDRKPVATHLPLSWTQASDADRNQLMNSLDDMLKQVKDTAGDS